jgi:hypothetical protein
MRASRGSLAGTYVSPSRSQSVLALVARRASASSLSAESVP